MSGKDVKAPQELLLRLGYVLPKYREKPSIAPGFSLVTLFPML